MIFAILGKDTFIFLVKVKSLVLGVKCSLVESSKSGSTPNCGVALNVVPSSIVPNLLPNIVENNVLTTNATCS